MVNENNKFIPQVPRTYEQFILEERQLVSEQERNLYPDLDYENVNEPVSYGPGLVSISGSGSSTVKLIAAGDASSLIGDAVGVKTCAALHCWSSIPHSEYYCFSHRNMVGEGITEQAKACDEIANREGGLVVVSQDRSAERVRTSVKYHSFR